KGYTIVSTGLLNMPPFLQSHAGVTCPAGLVPLGGGVFISSPSTAANVNTSYPAGDTWIGEVNNGTSAASQFNVFAVCAKAPKKYVLSASLFATVSPFTQFDGIHADCPDADAPALGGGVDSGSSSLLANINSTLPDARGWRVDYNN